MKSYTDEELSRILGEHGIGRLIRMGCRWWLCSSPHGCVNQAAYNIASPKLAWSRNSEPADRFDYGYNRDISHEELLRLLHGLQ